MENLRVRPTTLPKKLHVVLTSHGTMNFQFQDFFHMEYYSASLSNQFLIFQVNADASSLRVYYIPEKCNWQQKLQSLIYSSPVPIRACANHNSHVASAVV
jgi:hypothetical protein